MKRAILIITHGEFGIELVKSVEMIMGEISDIKAIGLRPGYSVENLRDEANHILDSNTKNGMETIVLVDLLGGSPSNVALSLLKKHDINILTGLNMPMLIELVSLYKEYEDTEEVIKKVLETANNSSKRLNRKCFSR